MAAAVFGAAALTDLFDGMVARKTGTVTRFGKIADPLADRLLVLAVLAVLAYTGDVPLWAAIVVVARDVSMVAGYRAMQARGLSPEVSYLGKVSTAVLMVSLALLTLAAPGTGLSMLALGVFFTGMALSLLSAAVYARDALRDVRLAAEKGSS